MQLTSGGCSKRTYLRDNIHNCIHIRAPVHTRAGSEYKVDASYLSPNVNIASRLEAATKQFGVSLLMSQVCAHRGPVPAAVYDLNPPLCRSL